VTAPITEPERPLSALPSPAARLTALLSILLGGAAGGFIGYLLVDVQCEGDCGLPLGLGVLFGSLAAAIGMAVVAVLVLRAVGEWRQLEEVDPDVRRRR
jgi:hypothetical protein